VVSLFSPKKSSSRLDRLRTLSLFINLSNQELRIISDLMHERTYLQDEVIFDEGEEGQAIYIITAGEIIIGRQGQSEAGRIARLGAGTFFGELALLDNSPRMAQAVAGSNCQLIVFFRDDFVGLLDTHAKISSKVLRELARHLGVRARQMSMSVGGSSCL
jgi:CRP-like cAMP-binding protein